MKIDQIIILSVPHSAQRYPTAGDWELVGGTLTIRVSRMPDQRMEWALALHELVEALLCTSRNITTEMVDEWDIKGEGAQLSEPGDDPRAPYFNEHMFATRIEEEFVNELDLNWHYYEDAIDNLTHEQENNP